MSQSTWDLIIVGAGPAGLSAALNGRIREKSTLILAAGRTPSRLQKAPHVKNYPGFNGITGEELYERFYQHAREMGVEFREERVENIYPGASFTVVTRSNQVYLGRALILATGIQQAHQLEGERELVGHGLGYCATCDGPLYRDKDVAVLGETPEAEEEVNFLAAIGRKVYYFPLYKGTVKVDRKGRRAPGETAGNPGGRPGAGDRPARQGDPGGRRLYHPHRGPG